MKETGGIGLNTTPIRSMFLFCLRSRWFYEWLHCTGIVSTLHKGSLFRNGLMASVAVEFCVWPIAGQGTAQVYGGFEL